jgi:hypothetical protein
VVIVVLFGGQLEHRRGELRGTHLEGQRTGQSRGKELCFKYTYSFSLYLSPASSHKYCAQSLTSLSKRGRMRSITVKSSPLR